MPVSTLFVEGDLDVQILTAVLAGSPVVQLGGSKNSLKPQARNDREKNNVSAAYLRDRDFDFEPPEISDEVVVDSTFHNSVLGWRWARHEIENYLLDPVIVERATGIDRDDWSSVLVEVAYAIRWYQIARWTIGQARRELPPYYQLETRPPGLNELQLPAATDENASRRWCTNSIGEFSDRVNAALAAESAEENLTSRADQLSEELLSESDAVLVWCSGKDLFAGLDHERLAQVSCQNAGELRAVLRDWIRENPEDTINCFSEWQNLISQMRA